MEITKAIIEHLLGWPFICLILGLFFKEPIATFLRRVTLFKGPGIELNAPVDGANKQLI